MNALYVRHSCWNCNESFSLRTSIGRRQCYIDANRIFPISIFDKPKPPCMCYMDHVETSARFEEIILTPLILLLEDERKALDIPRESVVFEGKTEADVEKPFTFVNVLGEIFEFNTKQEYLKKLEQKSLQVFLNEDYSNEDSTKKRFLNDPFYNYFSVYDELLTQEDKEKYEDDKLPEINEFLPFVLVSRAKNE